MTKDQRQQQIVTSLKPLINLLRHRLVRINYLHKRNVFSAKCKHCNWELKIIGRAIFVGHQYLTTYHEGVVGRITRGKFNEHICPKVAVML